MSEDVKGPQNQQPKYEDSEVSIGRLFAFAGGVVGLVVLGVIGSAAVFHFFVRHQPLGPPASPFEDVRPVPPEPRLQTDAPLDLKRYRQDQENILNTYGWVDAHAGVVRIPVERAMDVLLEKGIPCGAVYRQIPEQRKPSRPGSRLLINQLRLLRQAREENNKHASCTP